MRETSEASTVVLDREADKRPCESREAAFERTSREMVIKRRTSFELSLVSKQTLSFAYIERNVCPRIEPGTRRWKANAFTTFPSLLAKGRVTYWLYNKKGKIREGK